MTIHRTCGDARRSRTTVRRGGVAMLLVIVAVAVGTILSAAAISSTKSAGAIGENAEASVKSYWSAQAAAAYTERVIEQAASLASVGALAIPSSIAAPGGTVTVTVTDADGNAPDSGDRELIVTATALLNGQEHTVRRKVSVSPPGTVPEALDPNLSEFAAFVRTRIGADAGAIIGPWPASPESKSPAPVKIGLGSGSVSDVAIGSATTQRVALYPPPTASAQLDDLDDDAQFDAAGEKLPVAVPAVAALAPPEFATLAVARSTNMTMQFPAASATLAPGRYRSLTVSSGAVATLAGGSPARYQFNDLDISSSSILRISGGVEVLVRGQFNLSALSGIELADASAWLHLYVCGDVTVDDSTIGCSAEVARSASRSWKTVPYANPKRVIIRSVSAASGGTDGAGYTIDNKSIVLASIHAPTADLLMDRGSVLIGRATADMLEIKAGCGLLYDPALDSRIGFTSPGGPLFKADGTPIDGLAGALAGYNANSGCDALPATITSAVAAAAGADAVTRPSPRRITAESTPVSSALFESAAAKSPSISTTAFKSESPSPELTATAADDSASKSTSATAVTKKVVGGLSEKLDVVK